MKKSTRAQRLRFLGDIIAKENQKKLKARALLNWRASFQIIIYIHRVNILASRFRLASVFIELRKRLARQSYLRHRLLNAAQSTTSAQSNQLLRYYEPARREVALSKPDTDAKLSIELHIQSLKQDVAPFESTLQPFITFRGLSSNVEQIEDVATRIYDRRMHARVFNHWRSTFIHHRATSLLSNVSRTSTFSSCFKSWKIIASKQNSIVQELKTRRKQRIIQHTFRSWHLQAASKIESKLYVEHVLGDRAKIRRCMRLWKEWLSQRRPFVLKVLEKSRITEVKILRDHFKSWRMRFVSNTSRNLVADHLAREKSEKRMKLIFENWMSEYNIRKGGRLITEWHLSQREKITKEIDGCDPMLLKRIFFSRWNEIVAMEPYISNFDIKYW